MEGIEREGGFPRMRSWEEPKGVECLKGAVLRLGGGEGEGRGKRAFFRERIMIC